mgnify:CR=1 FL=1
MSQNKPIILLDPYPRTMDLLFSKENLKYLNNSLQKIRIPLTVIYSDGFNDNPKKILDTVKERSISKVFWNNMFGEDENIRDSKVKDILNLNNISFESFDDQVVYSPGFMQLDLTSTQLLILTQYMEELSQR